MRIIFLGLKRDSTSPIPRVPDFPGLGLTFGNESRIGRDWDSLLKMWPGLAGLGLTFENWPGLRDSENGKMSPEKHP